MVIRQETEQDAGAFSIDFPMKEKKILPGQLQ